MAVGIIYIVQHMKRLENAEKVTVSQADYDMFFKEVLGVMAEKGYVRGYLIDRVCEGAKMELEEIRVMGDVRMDFSEGVMEKIRKVDVVRGKKGGKKRV